MMYASLFKKQKQKTQTLMHWNYVLCFSALEFMFFCHLMTSALETNCIE